MRSARCAQCFGVAWVCLYATGESLLSDIVWLLSLRLDPFTDDLGLVWSVRRGEPGNGTSQ
jgi:hypothetical protein